MTPKQKAVELVDNFFISDKNLANSYMSYTLAIECAMIAVAEILGLGAVVGNDLSDTFYLYWQEVKQEIEKL